MKQLWCNVPVSYFANFTLQQATLITLSTQEARNFILEMAATCSHSSGRKWPQVAASILL